MEQFRRYAVQRVVIGILFAAVALWAISFLFGFLKEPAQSKLPPEVGSAALHDTDEASAAAQESLDHAPTLAPKQDPVSTGDTVGPGTEAAPPPEMKILEKQDRLGAVAPAKADDAETRSASALTLPRGVAFVTAAIKPLDYELNRRFWGWRPNDILDFTDNVNNFQLGVLEVTRRTVVVLAERISRRGANDAFNKNVEDAMNWLMIKADSYWFPSPESKYKDALEELGIYLEMLKQGKASFYTRQDSLIPLLQVFEDLMGGCEENLVKTYEKDGSKVSHFKADDYFFYAKGVSSAMGTILHAVAEDFASTVGPRRGAEVLETIITECHHATEIAPIYITNADLSGILANHRANLAARVSGARYYLGLLIKTLST